ncbi:hypothetical protein VM1G_04072 [Cytospora mali]|uniref:Uncharacterized protein n=1 Tax=Cytospora mali TaxID=578113 RepID=A0A194VWX8_CYTMA|nr:hypothetical protein VM1G_04072 [Valsa mali]
MPSKPHFSLGDQMAGVFAEICEKNAIASCWLQWKFELAILNEDSSPFTIDTNNDARCGRLKDGIKKVGFTIDFDHVNPNIINYIRFTEYHGGSENKYYIVTQTSIDHVHEDAQCKLWLELPPGTRKEDIGAVINLWKVQVCCDEWKEFLPSNPVTQLEKAHRVVAVENVQWLKTQLMKREAVVTRLDEELAQKDRDIASLTDDISELQMKLAYIEHELEQTRLREAGSAAKRKMLTPKSRAQRNPKTSSAKSSVSRVASDLSTTPSKDAMPRMIMNTEDPFVG